MPASAKLSKLLLLDFFHLAFFMLALGLIAYALIRRSNPLIRWNEHGNVWTQPFLKVDLLVLAAIIGSYYWGISKAAHSDKASPALDPDNIVSGMLAHFVLMAMLIGAILFVILYVRRVDPIELFGLRRLRPQAIFIWAIGIMLVAYPIAYLVGDQWVKLLKHSLGIDPARQELVEMMRDTTDLPVKLLMAFSACVVAPIAEEIMFRGYFYSTVKRFSERYFAAVVVSLLFAVIHNNTMAIVPLFVVAMAFTIAYELTGCLLVPILMHALFNLTTVIVIFSNA